MTPPRLLLPQGVLRDRQYHHDADHPPGHTPGQRQVRGVRGEQPGHGPELCSRGRGLKGTLRPFALAPSRGVGGTNNPSPSCLIKLLSLTFRIYSRLLSCHFLSLAHTTTLISDLHTEVTECWDQREVWRVPSSVPYFTDSKSRISFSHGWKFHHLPAGRAEASVTPLSLLLYASSLTLCWGRCALATPVSRLTTPPPGLYPGFSL